MGLLRSGSGRYPGRRTQIGEQQQGTPWTTSYELRAWAHTDQGKTRSHNEDSHHCDPDLGLFVVCDGLGGHAAGEVASALAVQHIVAQLTGCQPIEDFEADVAGTEQRKAVLDCIERALKFANTEVHTRACTEGRPRGMATTASVVVALGNRAFVGHVGDSRVYLVREGHSRQITHDHTIMGELLRRQHDIPLETIQQMPNRDSLTRAVGLAPELSVDTYEIELLPRDRLVACSDGLHRYLQGHEQHLVTLLDHGPMEQAAALMSVFANQQGGEDNVTSVIVEVNATALRTGMMDSLQQQWRSALDSVAGVRLFEHLEEQEVFTLLSMTEEVLFPKGSDIVVQGQPGDCMYLLIEGQVDVVVNGAVVRLLTAGTHFGEMALMSSFPRTATIRARTRVKARRLHRDPLYELLGRDLALCNRILWNMVQALTQRLQAVSQDSVELQHEKRQLIERLQDVADEPTLSALRIDGLLDED